MPRAGWCRECGEWVWVDENGACQHGHGPECVGGIREAEPQSVAAGFGRGEMPASLRRFNWGAFLLPLFWAIAYGAWPIAAFWLFAPLVPLAMGSILGYDGTAATLSVLIGVTIVSEALGGLVRLWAGANANRIVWRNEALRLEVVEGSQPRFTVERFTARQLTWMRVGWALMVVGAGAAAWLEANSWGEFGLKIPGGVMPILWLVAEVALAVWLSGRMRAESPDSPEPLGNTT